MEDSVQYKAALNEQKGDDDHGKGRKGKHNGGRKKNDFSRESA